LASAAIEMRLQARFTEAAAALPSVALPWERFLSRVAGRLDADADTVDALHVDDLYLACACAEGDPEAMRVLDERVLQAVPLMVARIDASPAFGDEVRQAVRTKLLVGAEGAGAIAGYGGRGALRSWVQVAAIRIALNLRRGVRPQAELGDAEADRILATPDPELAFIKHRAKEDFRLAFQAALAQLPSVDRHMLRLHYLDRLSLGQLGALEGVDKSTMSRRIAAVRQTLLDETHRVLRERLRLDESELDSLMGAIASQLDVSIESFLKTR
jgi:RNA polymerase sigma-70 factor (ECF subfamily)